MYFHDYTMLNLGTSVHLIQIPLYMMVHMKQNLIKTSHYQCVIIKEKRDEIRFRVVKKSFAE